MKATVIQTEIEIKHSIRPDVDREFITFDVPNGWDDVKKICKKVLSYDDRKFVFSGWNSDGLYCCFYRMLNGSAPKIAKILN